ncbi:MAG TPA: PHB depolymerase family esterase [Steroidobacteraceae bacterium]|nr:PHB depolymerase family esterase [Steroidobacteraceae bacterium]
MENVELYRSRRRAAPHHASLATALLALGLGTLPVEARAAAHCADRGARAPEARCESLLHDGRERTYRLYVPPRLAAPAPLLVVLHGGGGGGAGMEVLTARGFNRRADESGALVVYPDGVGHTWNDGRHDVWTQAVAENVDDVGFLKALVTALAARYPLDRARVFVTGMSNGGMMTLKLACEARDVFSGFVAVASSLNEQLAGSCEATGIARLALIDGTEDPMVPWAGGTVAVLGMARGRVIGAPKSFARFLAAARCRSERTEPQLDRIAGDGTQLTLHVGEDCAGGAEVRLYEVDGGGHAWPGGPRYAPERLIGKVSRELDATDETWRFLGLAAGKRPGPV